MNIVIMLLSVTRHARRNRKIVGHITLTLTYIYIDKGNFLFGYTNKLLMNIDLPKRLLVIFDVTDDVDGTYDIGTRTYTFEDKHLTM